MKRLTILLLSLLSLLSCSSMFRAKYFYTSQTNYTYQNDLKIVTAQCDLDVRLCYENTQKACNGQYHIKYMTMKEISLRYYIDRPCRRAGVFSEQCESDGLGKYYDIREWYIEKYMEYTLTSECK